MPWAPCPQCETGRVHSSFSLLLCKKCQRGRTPPPLVPGKVAPLRVRLNNGSSPSPWNENAVRIMEDRG